MTEIGGRAIAIISNRTVEYTTANYFRDVLQETGTAFSQFTPGEQDHIPREYDIRFYVDDGTHYAIQPVQHALKILYLIDTHMGMAEDLVMARLADVVFCAQRNAVDPLRKRHQHVHWLPLACDPAIHYRDVERKQYDVAFVGGIADQRREEILRLLADRYPRSFIGRAPRDKIGEIYSTARIVVNVAINNDINMRFFEAMCSGALLLTDVIEDNGMEELLAGQEEAPCVFYRNEEELLARIDYYLANEMDRAAIARRGLEFSRRHTYHDRWDAIQAAVAGIPPRSPHTAEYLSVDLRLRMMAVGHHLKRFLPHA